MNDPQAPETTTTEAPAPAETTSTPAPAPAEPAKPLSSHDAIRAAAKKLSSSEPNPAKPSEKAPETKPAQPRGEHGHFASPNKGDEPAKPQEPAQALQTPPEKPPEPAAPEFKPPQSWSPAAREALAKADPAVRAEVLKRERDYAQGIQQHAERAKVGDAFREVVSPFEAMIRAEGGEPIAAVRSLLQTSVALRTAPLPQRADMLWSMIERFLGTDDNALNQLAQAEQRRGGQVRGQAQQQPQFDPAALVRQVKQEIAQERQTAILERKRAEIAQFAETHEHLPKVQHVMGALFDQATADGKSITMDEAYHSACMVMVPEYAAAERQKEAAKAATASQEAQRRAEAAASSVRSQPAGVPVKPGTNLDRGAAIRQAAAAVANRGRV